MLNNKYTAVFIATALTLLIAPGAGAHKPYQEPIELEAGVLPGCSFDVGFQPASREYMRIFDSGRFTVHSYGRPTLTNLDSGDAKVYGLRYLFQETVDPETGDVLGQISGRSLWFIAPGDVGPAGEVDPDGGLLHIVGQLRYVADPATFAITSLTVDGTVTDVCAALAS
jgi:hypothetical protein